MPLKVSFQLADADLQHFQEMALQTQAGARDRPQDAIMAAARELLDKGMQAQPADFVRERYARLRSMLEMANDADWRLSDEDRQRAVNALACFSAPATPPGAGSFDYAIMIELVSRDLHHDLEAYRDFCRFRTALAGKRSAAPAADREQQLSQKRDALQARMHKRRKRDLDAAGGSVRKLFSLFRL